MEKNGVICAIDVNDFDQNVVEVAASFAKHFGVDLDLVHVSIYPDPIEAAWPAYVGSPHILAADNRLLRKIKTAVPDVEVHYHHLSGLPSQKVLEFVDRNEPRLLVLGSHARRGISRILGSIASKIMRRASCPVMVRTTGPFVPAAPL